MRWDGNGQRGHCVRYRPMSRSHLPWAYSLAQRATGMWTELARWTCARDVLARTRKASKTVLAEIFREAVDYESDGECEHVEPQEEPMLPASEVVAMELLAQHRVEATLTQARALKASAEVLQEYRALGGDI